MITRTGRESVGSSRGSRHDPARSLTRPQVDALAALAVHGSYATAAASLGISFSSYNSRMSRAYERLGISYEHKTSHLLAFRVLGWLRVPGEDAA